MLKFVFCYIFYINFGFKFLFKNYIIFNGLKEKKMKILF